MRRLLLPLLLCLFAAPRLVAQTGIVTADARERLAATWDTRDSAIEHMHCVTHWAIGNGGFVYVLRVQPAAVSHAGPDYVMGTCDSDKQPTIHTHPPTSCDEEFVPGAGMVATHCKAGGVEAWLCTPSGADSAFLRQRGAPFDVMQCDKNAFIFYFNPAYRPDPSSP